MLSESSIVTLALGAWGVIASLMAIIYKQTIIRRFDAAEIAAAEFRKEMREAIHHIHDCLHDRDKRLAVLEHDQERDRGFI